MSTSKRKPRAYHHGDLRTALLRTAGEINRERTALKALRGDFNSVAHAMGESRADVALKAAQL